jgi:hypothetical protein
MTSQRKIYWLAPTTMITSFLGGFLLALGHHLFYASRAGDIVPTGSYSFLGTTLQKQQFNTSVGTALAFLVKTFLSVAISVAYIQLFWLTAHRAKQNPRLGDVDWVTSGLSNVFSLVYPNLWWKYPILGVSALVFW